MFGRRRLVRACALALTALLAVAATGCDGLGSDGSGGSAPTSAVSNTIQTRPNIIMFLTDDMRTDELKYLPHVKALLADQGVTFTHALSPNSLCCPARTTLLSGMYSHNTKVIGNSLADHGGWPVFKRSVDQTNLLPDWLQAAGYRTWHIGKHVNQYNTLFPQPGWDFWDATVRDEYDYHHWIVSINGRQVVYKHAYQESILRKKLLYGVDAMAPSDQPFFMWAGSLAPHGTDHGTPPDPQPEFAASYKRLSFPLAPSFREKDVSDKPRWVSHEPNKGTASSVRGAELRRIQSLLSVDQTVAETVARLKKLGELDNTVFIFTSDNGYQIGEHRHHGKNTPYEESIGVPLVIRGPGFPAGTTYDGLVTLADVTRTIASLAGATPGLTPDGLSLVNVADSRAMRAGRVIPLEGGGWQIPNSDRLPRDKLGRFYWGARTSHYVYVEYATGEHEFYNLLRDPYELDNAYRTGRAATPAQRALANWVRLNKNCRGQQCERPLPALAHR